MQQIRASLAVLRQLLFAPPNCSLHMSIHAFRRAKHVRIDANPCRWPVYSSARPAPCLVGGTSPARSAQHHLLQLVALAFGIACFTVTRVDADDRLVLRRLWSRGKRPSSAFSDTHHAPIVLAQSVLLGRCSTRPVTTKLGSPSLKSSQLPPPSRVRNTFGAQLTLGA